MTTLIFYFFFRQLLGKQWKDIHLRKQENNQQNIPQISMEFIHEEFQRFIEDSIFNNLSIQHFNLKQFIS